MMPHEPVLDMMRRTMANLEFVERHAKRDGPFEVTQLINSFLGALAHPWESMEADLNRMSLEIADQRGWPILQAERPSDIVPTSLGHLLGLLRNGIAHGNLAYLPGNRGQIAALQIENRNRQKRRTWGVTVTVAEMRSFLEHFVALAEELEGGRSRQSVSPDQWV